MLAKMVKVRAPQVREIFSGSSLLKSAREFIVSIPKNRFARCKFLDISLEMKAYRQKCVASSRHLSLGVMPAFLNLGCISRTLKTRSLTHDHLHSQPRSLPARAG